jgi:hypothetical protein
MFDDLNIFSIFAIAQSKISKDNLAYIFPNTT